MAPDEDMEKDEEQETLSQLGKPEAAQKIKIDPVRVAGSISPNDSLGVSGTAFLDAYRINILYCKLTQEFSRLETWACVVFFTIPLAVAKANVVWKISWLPAWHEEG